MLPLRTWQLLQAWALTGGHYQLAEDTASPVTGQHPFQRGKTAAPEVWVPLVGYLVVALLYLLPLPFYWLSSVPGDNGDSITNLWPFWYYAHAAVTKSLGMFQSPLQFFPDGISLVFTSGSPLGAMLMAPLTLLVSPAAGMNTWLLLHIWLGGFLFFRFCRRAGAGSWGSWLGGFAYACSPFVAVHLPGHYTLVQIAFTPAAMLALASLAESAIIPESGWRSLIAPGICLAISCWAVAVTDFYLATMTLFLLIITLLHLMLVHGRRLMFSRSFWVVLGLSCVVTLTLLSPWVALIMQAREGHDYSAIDPGMGSKNVARWSRLVTIPAYHSVWEPRFFEVFVGKLSIFNEWTYLGMIGLFVAGVGMLFVRDARRTPAWIIGFIVALGLAGANRYTIEPAWPSGPLSFGRWWPDVFPFSEFRVPGRWHFVLCTTLAVGIALGSDALFSRMRAMPRGLAAVAIFALMAFDLLRWPMPICDGRPLPSAIQSAEIKQGAVLDVPVGIISGQGHSLGHYDKAALQRQMSHGRPVLSANVSRLPGDVVARRKADAELSAFFKVQDGDDLTSAMAGLDWSGFRARYHLTTVRIPRDWPTSAPLMQVLEMTGNRWHWKNDRQAVMGEWK